MEKSKDESEDRCTYCGCFTTEMGFHWARSCRETSELYKEGGYQQKPVLAQTSKSTLVPYTKKVLKISA